jgi:hypothetical protein
MGFYTVINLDKIVSIASGYQALLAEVRRLLLPSPGQLQAPQRCHHDTQVLKVVAMPESLYT